jgi:hypothetical protein
MCSISSDGTRPFPLSNENHSSEILYFFTLTMKPYSNIKMSLHEKELTDCQCRSRLDPDNSRDPRRSSHLTGSQNLHLPRPGLLNRIVIYGSEA